MIVRRVLSTFLRKVVPMFGLVCVQLIAANAADASVVGPSIPYQFIAKSYTEGLGRAPDQSGWAAEAAYFSTGAGCNTTTLAFQASRVLTSSEFTGLSHSNPALVEIAYRTLLNREPDASGYATWLSYLNGGMPWSTVLNDIEASPEFDSLATNVICNGGGEYGFGSNAPIALSPSGPGFIGTEAALQALLNSTPSGGTVALASRSLVSLTSTLTIPAGVILTTTGSPSTQQYADMGRLSRAPGWTGESVHISGGATVTHVWIDGDRTVESSYNRDRFNIRLYGGSGTTVSYDRIGNTAGATNIELEGGCTSAFVTNNLFDAYSSSHANGLWSDGISDGCENSTISGNAIVDASDVGIILFAGSPAQTSHVTNNTVIQAGHGAYALLAADPSTGQPNGNRNSFSGAQITNNTIWTAPTAVSTFGISDGTYAWFGTLAAIGSGALISGNTAGSLNVYSETGIDVSGMLQTTVTGNTLNWSIAKDPQTSCPQHNVGASVAAGFASGTIQTYSDALYSSCI